MHTRYSEISFSTYAKARPKTLNSTRNRKAARIITDLSVLWSLCMQDSFDLSVPVLTLTFLTPDRFDHSVHAFCANGDVISPLGNSVLFPARVSRRQVVVFHLQVHPGFGSLFVVSMGCNDESEHEYLWERSVA